MMMMDNKMRRREEAGRMTDTLYAGHKWTV